MTKRPILRRRFLTGAAAAAAGGLAASHLAKAQGDAPRTPATPRVPPADLILKNGKIVTVDPAFTIAQAIAIAAERIIAVGPDEAMAAHTGAATRVVDLKGKTVARASPTGTRTWTGKRSATFSPRSGTCARSGTSRIGLPSSPAASGPASGS